VLQWKAGGAEATCVGKENPKHFFLMFQNLYFKHLNTDKHHDLKLQCIRVQTPHEPDQK